MPGNIAGGFSTPQHYCVRSSCANDKNDNIIAFDKHKHMLACE
jgi:hypothetical protein